VSGNVAYLTIRLGAVDYRIPKLNVAELRSLASCKVVGDEADFEIVRIGLTRAEPPVANFAALEPDLQQIRDAADRLLVFAGFKQPGARA
jgi:hypothetical protein